MYTIVIVDDEAIERETIKKMLQDNCLDITTIEEARNGREAIEIISRLKPDLVMMDIEMPGINGIKAAQEIRNRGIGSKIIFLTAYNVFHYAQEAVRVSAMDFLLKPASEEDILDVIYKALEEVKKEKQQQFATNTSKEKIEHLGRYLEEQMIAALIGGYVQREKLQEYLEELRMTFCEGIFSVIEVMEIQTVRKEEMHSKISRFIKKEFLKKGLSFMVYSYEQYIYVLFVGDEQYKLDEAFLVTCLNEIIIKCKKQYQISLKVGVGSKIDTINEANKSFYEAQLAVRHAVSKEVLPVGEIHSRSMKVGSILQIENEIYDAIVCDDKEKCMVHLAHLFAELEKLEDNMVMIKQHISYSLVAITRKIYKESSVELLQKLDFHHEVMIKSDLHELWNYISKIIGEVLLGNHLVKMDKTSKMMQEVERYIRDNYMKDISLEEIAYQMNLSVSYLSKIFKQSKGINFIDYLIDFRLMIAKELMREVKLSIKDIGMAIGYNDSNYFCKLFKKKMGMTPTKYREELY